MRRIAIAITMMLWLAWSGLSQQSADYAVHLGGGYATGCHLIQTCWYFPE
jgi:hypothetical protein